MTPVEQWHEQTLSLGGPGAPEVAEFCVAEFAAVLGLSTDSGRELLGDAVELRYRLPRLCAVAMAGGVRVWKARLVAQSTRSLSEEAARFVDRHLAPIAGRVGFAAIGRLVEEALVRFDPAAAQEARRAATDHRCFDGELSRVGFEGTVAVTGSLDLTDALDLEAAVARGARHLGGLGSVEALDVRRSVAVGELAGATWSSTSAPRFATARAVR